MILKIALLVGIGGATGALCRWGLSETLQRISGDSFPWGTFAVNSAGAFLVGLCFVWIIERGLPVEYRYLLITGVLGGFTTYSAFSLESYRLLESGHIMSALVYIVATTLTCLLATALGIVFARSI